MPRLINFSSEYDKIYKYNDRFEFISEKKIELDQVSNLHLGVPSSYEENLWYGVIDLDDYNLGLSDTRVIQVSKETLEIINEHILSHITNYIDSFLITEDQIIFSKKYFLHKLVFDEKDSLFKRDAFYSILTGTSQGMRVHDKFLYVVPENKTLESIGLPQGVYAYELEKLESNDYTFLNRIIIKIENFLFPINRRTGLSLFNFRLFKNINIPDKFWPVSFPNGKPDNKGFTFCNDYKNTIWISDVYGNKARKIYLKD